MKIIMAITASGTIMSVNQGRVASTRRSRATTRRAAKQRQDADAAVEQQVHCRTTPRLGSGPAAAGAGQEQFPGDGEEAGHGHVQATVVKSSGENRYSSGRGAGRGRRVVTMRPA